MAARSLQVSQYEIQREVEALRDLRRRSTTPGALTIDPDLPNQAPSSPTSTYWSSTPSSSITINSDASTPSTPSDTSSDNTSQSSHTSSGESTIDDPLHLFWVPARLHPEIAPAEFRAFLKEHARAPNEPSTNLERSASLSAPSGLGRKKSMLSRQYKPSENDDPEEDKVVPLQRNRSNVFNRGPQLTINDLQKLEKLAEEAADSDDPSQLRSVLRRSLSLNISPTALSKLDSNVLDLGDEADAPIIVPLPGQIVRRAARTKIRKPGLPAGNGAHRFTGRRATPARTVPPSAEPRTSSEMSSSDHGDDPTSPPSGRFRSFSNERLPNGRPDSYSEDAVAIIDFYERRSEDSLSNVGSPPEAPSAELPLLPPVHEPAPASLLEVLGPILDQPPQDPQPVFVAEKSAPDVIIPPRIRTPSPELPPPVEELAPEKPPELELQEPVLYIPTIPPSLLDDPLSTKVAPPSAMVPTPAAQPVPAQQQYPIPQPQTSQEVQPAPPPRKDKDKKAGLFKWGSSKQVKDKGGEKEKEKEKDGSFFSWFGGGSKKKQDQEVASISSNNNAGREAAQALLGASKSSKNHAQTSPGLAPPVGNSYARYPIHVERAIYRLSHIKLANPRRPLYEQVLISNLMFWYLGVINKAQNPTSTINAQQQATNGPPQAGAPTPAKNNQNGHNLSLQRPLSEAETQLEKERREKEMERAEQERQEQEQKEREQKEREQLEVKKKESGRKGSLTKAPAAGQGRRVAEMPVRGPQYEMQHRVMEQEYGNGQAGAGGVGVHRSQSAPASGINGNQYQRSGQPPLPPQSQPASPTNPNYYFSSEQGPPPPNQKQQQLPPGAMPPIPLSHHQQQELQWGPQGQGYTPQRGGSPSPPLSGMVNGSGAGGNARRSRSPPPGVVINGGNIPGRSLSATASLPSAGVNGKPTRGTPPIPVPQQQLGQKPRPRTSEGDGEEEDVPLAVWQQQRRR